MSKTSDFVNLRVTLTLALPYVVQDKDRDVRTCGVLWSSSDRQITDHIIKEALRAHAPKKVPGGLKRENLESNRIATIQKILSMAVRDEEDSVELDGEQFKAVRTALEEWEVKDPGHDLMSWIGDLWEHVEDRWEDLKARQKAAKASENGKPAETPEPAPAPAATAAKAT